MNEAIPAGPPNGATGVESRGLDPITIELIQTRLTSIVREMRTVIIRTAYSHMIIEGHDFSSAVLSPAGELVAASQIEQPTHISALSWSAREVLARYGDDIGPGDLYLHNDPYTGGSHLNDVGICGRARHAAGARAARSRQPVSPRYARQGFELTVDLAGAPSEPDDVRHAFLEAYARQYGHAHASGDIEIVNLRTTVIGVTPKPRVRRLRHGGKMADATLPPRDLVVEGKSIPVSVYERGRLPVDVEFEGPAVIEEAGATTVMLPRWRGRRDDLGNLRFEAVG